MPSNNILIDSLPKSGEVAHCCNLSGILMAENVLSGTLSLFKGNYEPYTGQYSISPDFEGITISTANKYLYNDISIEPIQVESVSNISGGRTVFIGGII